MAGQEQPGSYQRGSGPGPLQPGYYKFEFCTFDDLFKDTCMRQVCRRIVLQSIGS